jgi:ergothioneine biosynthesis protein EgtB
MAGLLDGGPPAPELERALVLGLHHEQQHQELLVADIKYILRHNRVAAPYASDSSFEAGARAAEAAPLRFVPFAGGVYRAGHRAPGFAFDNETPAHDVLLRPFALAGRLVTNGEYRAFIEDGGYRDFRHWLSDGWDRVRAEGWTGPLYWTERLDPAEPVCHVSYFEADAFARWAGKRLPSEFEWEFAAAATGPDARGRFLEDGKWRPAPAPAVAGLSQLFGDAWEWTSSFYGPYPGFRPAAGAFGEYNGKFMSGQFVLRGGSCATPRDHIRKTYRNFFQPEKRWQFMGVRLACDA